MAFRNSLKATLLLEEAEQPRSRLAEAGPNFEAAPVAEPPRAKPPRVAPPFAASDTVMAAAWHRRAEELCAMADTLPCQSSWSLISKIASLYDELAREAGWSDAEGSASEAPRSADEARAEEEPLAAEEPPAPTPPADPPPPARISFPRRPLPLGRPVPRRRA
jgi:hypothetical protein